MKKPTKAKAVTVDETKLVVTNLMKFKRWLSGRGRKYVAGQTTVDIEVICSSLGIAIESMKHRLSHDEFKRLVCIAQKWCPNVAEDKKAMSAAKRIVRYIDKADAK